MRLAIHGNSRDRGDTVSQRLRNEGTVGALGDPLE